MFCVIDKKGVVYDFEAMKDRAGLNALSKLSLKQPLTEKQRKRMKELFKELIG